MGWSVATQYSVLCNLSPTPQIWCSTKIPNRLTVFDAKTYEKKYTFENTEEANKPINVILPVNNQVRT